MDEIIRMQEHLLLIRRTVGWTAEEFGDRIGVTRQTINNIEFGRNKLTKTQYIAMRSVLDAEMTQNPDDTTMLRLLLDALVDHPENYKEPERAEILSKANLMAPAILAGTATRKTVSTEWIRSMAAAAGIGATLAAMPLIGAVANGVVSGWLMRAIESKRKNGGM
ncbi:MAG: helix-turn-helix transcriptional regulator [Oscillospiraceae bacterium]|nr:helix-turn-helix transcriptional regulator [Oscillospiraceae bacterium]